MPKLGLRKKQPHVETSQSTTPQPPAQPEYTTFIVGILQDDELLRRFVIVASTMEEALTKLTAFMHTNPMLSNANSIAIEEIMAI